MAANLGPFVVVVLGIFALFMVGLAYGAWMTRSVELTHRP